MKFLNLICLLVLLGCKDAPKTSSPPEDQGPKSKSTMSTLPSISEAEVLELYETCDFVDYIFYELPFSMSYDKQGTIRSALKWINTTTPEINPNCKPLARMIFQRKGEQMIEADLYVSEECAHLIWIKDGAKTYANQISTQGKEHFMGIIKQFSK